MAFRYLIYSTGTTFAETIVRESAIDDPGAFEASLFSDFVIPEIQPVYLWRVTGGTTVEPNTDANINAYLQSIAPPPEPEDDASVGYVTGLTSQKIDKVTGATGNLGQFVASGNLEDSGYAVSDLTGGTNYNFTGSGATQVTTGSTTGGTVQIVIYSTPSTGSTVAWGDITGTLSAQTDLQDALNLKLDITDFNSYTGATATELSGKLESSVFNAYTGSTQPVIDAAITGVTNLGTGTTLGLVSGRDITLKSVSVLGGLSLSGDADNLIISGQTGGTSSTAWGDITGTLSDQTDLWDELTGITATSANKLDTSVFNTFTGTTLPDNYYNKTEINSYTGTTATLIGTKLDESAFNAYTGDTQPVIDAALTGATNGLTATGRDVELGGTLTKDTGITGLTESFSINTQTISLQAINGIDIIDTDGVGGINIESDAGTISLVGNDSLSAELTRLEISETLMRITDSRTTQVGMVYAGDYSTDFTNESLITKRYADTIAGGLIPKAAVLVATTGDTALSGLTTIDGVSLSNGDRVLVKDQTDGTENGIYVASASTWSRSDDYDGTPEGEVSAGNIIPVLSGDTQYSTLWVLVTPNPITLGSTALDFTLYSSPHELIPGVGINISGNVIDVDGSSLAGSSIAWTGNTFNVDTTTGTVASALALKLDTTVFNSFTGTTLPANYVSTTTFNSFTGTTLPANYYNKTEINSYTGTTDTRLNNIEADITGLSATTATKLDTVVFNSYTGATAPNEIFLVHTGGTELNTVAATAIEWDTANVSGSSFNWSGSSEIQVLETGDYEISYNVPFTSNENNRTIGIGGNIILNNSTVSNDTSSGAVATDNGAVGKLSLATVILSLTANDILTLAAFRTSDSGSATSAQNGSILIKKKNTLQ